MTVLFDENLPQRWKEYLAPHGIAGMHWTEVGNPGDPDELLFEYARTHRATLITQDLDFTRMLALHGACLPSVIQLRVEAPIPEVIGQAVLSALIHYRKHLEAGCLITIDANRKRLRLLPLH